MNRQKLEVFLNLAKTLNYTETAEQLYTTQGNISKQILALEKEMGVRLFNRQHRSIRLTEVGETVLERVQAIQQAYKDLDAVLHQYKYEKETELTLYGLPSMSSYQLFTWLGEFYQLHPELTLNVEEDEGTQLDKLLANGTCQLIFNRYFQQELPERALLLEKDKAVVLLPKQHPLAQQDVIDVADLRDDCFLELGATSQFYHQLVRLCEEAGFQPAVTYQGKRLALILELLAQGVGISVVMQKSVESLITDAVVLRPLKQDFSCFLCLVRQDKPMPPIAEDFWKFVQKKVEKI